MADPIKQALAELATTQERLNDLDTRISIAIRDVEERIRDHVSTRIAIVVGLPNRDEAVLAFGKHDGKWCLVLEERGGPKSGPQRTPLLSVPREVRAEVFVGGHIEHLIRAAASQIADQIAGREVAVRNADELLDALGRPAPIKERRRG